MHSDRNSQQTISSYFSPSPVKSTKRRERPVSPIDLTSDAEGNDFNDEPPIKKIKVARPSQSRVPAASQLKKPSHTSTYTQSTLFAQTLSTPSRSGAQAQARSRDMAEQWAFTPQPSQPQDSPSAAQDGTRRGPQAEAKKMERHEAFKKKLLMDNSRFRLRPGALGASPTDDVAGLSRDRTPAPEDEDIAESSGDDSDPAFADVMNMFSNSVSSNKKGKKKATAESSSRNQSGKRASAVAKRGSKKPPPKIGPSGQAYTPLELQVLELKENNPDTLLMIEVGYKYKFFGNDAKVAAKELGMIAYNDRNFVVASVPVDRRNVHLKKLLARGYRVGIVDQVETAALKKVSENRNAPFDRKLTELYTATTYVDDLRTVDELETYSPPPFMCLVEESQNLRTGDVSVAIITICPSTGDVTWDDFQDTFMRTELETRLVHLRPAELLVPERGISESTTKMLRYFTGNSATGDKLRIEPIKELMPYSEAFLAITNFYTDQKQAPSAPNGFQSGRLVAEIIDFPKRVVVALAHAIKYLSSFNVADALLETKFFSKFTTRAHMLLGANTITNLEVYRNETDYTVKGSLMEILNKTDTKFGLRLLKEWIGRPLVDKSILQERVNAVEEMLSSESDRLMILRDTLKGRPLLKGLPDLAKGLCRIQYGQCTPPELAELLPAFKMIGDAFPGFQDHSGVGLESRILNEIIFSLPKLRPALADLIGAIKLNQAREGRKDLMWQDPDKYPDIMDAAMSLQTVEVELAEELKSIRKLLRMPSLQWTSHLNDEYLVEVKKANSPPIPDTWVMHSRTAKFVRYQPPSVREKVEARTRFQELLEGESSKAYQEFLKEISSKYYSVLRDTVNKLAIADCLSSLARVALEKGYVKPEFTDDDSLEITEGRHPIIEVIRNDPFVPNSITMGFGKPRNKIITGPNMGGKSSFVKMVALLVLMAQVGSYVPAQSIKMGLHDSILTRMGASDDLAKGRSTFMVEMSETSDILHTATSRSLVILDELGRGTSTFDGMAIADAVLQQLVNRTKSKTLFITHYPLVASGIEREYPQGVENIHMGYTSDVRVGGVRDITFLYKVEPGITTESYGIECARLAGMPENILEIAAGRAQEFQRTTEDRIKKKNVRKVLKALKHYEQDDHTQPPEIILRELKNHIDALSTST